MNSGRGVGGGRTRGVAWRSAFRRIMEDALAAAVRTALAGLPDLPADFDPEAVAVEFQTPNDPTHGDLATNVAMQLARPLRRNPRPLGRLLPAGR